MTYYTTLTASACKQSLDSCSHGHTGEHTLQEVQYETQPYLPDDIHHHCGGPALVDYSVQLASITIEGRDFAFTQEELDAIAEQLLTRHTVTAETELFEFDEGNMPQHQAITQHSIMNAVEFIDMPEGVTLDHATWDWNQVRKLSYRAAPQ